MEVLAPDSIFFWHLVLQAGRAGGGQLPGAPWTLGAQGWWLQN